ncbi:hypothetical protein PCL_12559 [Purpureocillium lilacinum]|uniref:Uncharacterized protein n=1 Tax=Purpureocillium lilacinum TaxID=33203 RepID=A0A2U3E9M2_PURLI|nr:hypothetical protein PCL_12559 [Purpureocillium lilacinum]
MPNSSLLVTPSVSTKQTDLLSWRTAVTRPQTHRPRASREPFPRLQRPRRLPLAVRLGHRHGCRANDIRASTLGGFWADADVDAPGGEGMTWSTAHPELLLGILRCVELVSTKGDAGPCRDSTPENADRRGIQPPKQATSSQAVKHIQERS